MRRSRPQKELASFGSSIPRSSVAGRRSSSVDCTLRRGSYQPSNRRTSSSERAKVPGSAIKPARSSPRASLCNIFPAQRGSLVDRKHILKDNRPLSDKGYQKQCIQLLVNYLEENNFPFQISQNSLMMPQMKDFINIFQFLYQKFDPSFQLKRVEEEAPKVLKMLGYPFTLSKSSFRTITRMSWPQLLGTLTWLLDLCKISDSVNLITITADNEIEDSEGQSILLNYVLQSYYAGIDDPVKEMEVFEGLVSRKCDVDFDTEDMEKEIAQVQAEVEERTNLKARYDEMVKYNKGVAKDIENLKQYVHKMATYMTQKSETLESLKTLQEEKEKEIESLQSLIAEKEKLYNAQGFDGHRAQNFYALRKKKLMEKVNEKCDDFKIRENECWDLKIEITEISDKLDSLCQAFNLAWEEFQGIVGTALTPLSTSGIPAAVKLYKENKLALPDLQVMPTSCTDVKKVLDKVKDHILELHQQVQNIIASQDIHISQIEACSSELAVKQEVSSALLEQKQRELEMITSSGEKEIVAMRVQCEALQNKLNDSRDKQLKMDQQIIDLKTLNEDLKAKLSEISSNCTKQGIEAEESCRKTFQLIQQTYSEINAKKQKIDESMQDLLKIINENPL